MDGNLIAMLASLVFYIGFLGIAAARKVNLKFLALISLLVAFWFGFQWVGWKGVLSVMAGMVAGVIVLRLVLGNKNNTPENFKG